MREARTPAEIPEVDDSEMLLFANKLSLGTRRNLNRFDKRTQNQILKILSELENDAEQLKKLMDALREEKALQDKILKTNDVKEALLLVKKLLDPGLPPVDDDLFDIAHEDLLILCDTQNKSDFQPVLGRKTIATNATQSQAQPTIARSVSANMIGEYDPA